MYSHCGQTPPAYVKDNILPALLQNSGFFPLKNTSLKKNRDLNCLTGWKSITDNVTAKVVFLAMAERFCKGSPGSLQYF